MAVLATWRVTHLLAEEDGPADLVVRFRKLLGDSFVGRMMDCFYCLSVWIAAPAALFITRRPLEWFMNWLALSGGACLLERLTTKHAEPHVLRPLEEGSEQGGIENVLRFETYADQGRGGSDATDNQQPAQAPQR
ncbi:DUF1360 domain-containing protein [Occallatibacter riparius]|uniref:DUF1360 domain-containing protein n=1 Tax=Occallatibacter riparius TaxID=1002689 RepID=A0A9J7BRA2_9BACT|nr:DUF1360 domain-containing protein [Occallatibacter riparius]UWZ85404.1 DUF1360 domain-containing protein [Occallatibacter riparius]